VGHHSCSATRIPQDIGVRRHISRRIEFRPSQVISDFHWQPPQEVRQEEDARPLALWK
jgi:hypothetical protein